MKKIVPFVCFLLLLSFSFNCKPVKTVVGKHREQPQQAISDTVAIANDSLSYEIIIIDPGFSSWLASVARPEGYYTQSFLEARNYQYVVAWNNRVRQPSVYNPDLYEMIVDYDPNIDYGYEVNYKLYNYFIYFQKKYHQRLAGFIPRI